MSQSSPTAPNLSFPLLAPAQALKHITINEALCALDAVTQISVERADLADPPDTPEPNARFIVGSDASGAWEGHDGAVAQWQVFTALSEPSGSGQGQWEFVEPKEGWVLWDRMTARLMIRIGTDWVSHADTLPPPDRLGVNATPDAVNRFAVASASTLLTHDGTDHRVTVNRAGDADTASLLFKTDHSAEAEIGLTGANGLSVKTYGGSSPQWRDAIVTDAETGAVRFPNSDYRLGGQHNLFRDSGVFMGSPQPTSLAAQPFVQPDWALPHNGATIGLGETFHYNSQTNGGSATANTSVAQALAMSVFDPSILRFMQSFHTARITSGASTAFAVSDFADGITRYLSFRRATNTVPLTMTYSVYILAETAPVGCLGEDTVNPDGVAMQLDGMAVSGAVLVPADGNWHHLIIHDQGDPAFHLRRDTLAFRFYSEPGSTYQLGFPTAMAGFHTVRPDIGLVPSLEAFSR